MLVSCRPGEYCDPHSRLLLQAKAIKGGGESEILFATDVASGGVAAGRACAMALARKPFPPGSQRPSDVAISGTRAQEIDKKQANVLCRRGP